MAKENKEAIRKRLRFHRNFLEDQPGGVIHKDGLTPLQTKIARITYERVGHLFCDFFEHWERGFMRVIQPGRMLATTEVIARTFEYFMARHPKATKIVWTTILACTGAVSHEDMVADWEKELMRLSIEARMRMWVPLVIEPFEFSRDVPLLVNFEELVDEADGVLYPNLSGERDFRQALVAADNIIGADPVTGERHCIHGSDRLSLDKRLPGETKTIVVLLNTEDDEKNEVDKLSVMAEMAKLPPDLG